MKQATYIRYVIAKLLRFVQIACWPLQSPMCRGFFENITGVGTSFKTTFLIYFFDNNFYFLILHKLVKFHCQNVYFPIYSIIRVSGFILRHVIMSWDIWKSQKLKFAHLKNEKSFPSEIKNICLVSQALSFRHTKQRSKNIGDTTFNYISRGRYRNFENGDANFTKCGIPY